MAEVINNFDPPFEGLGVDPQMWQDQFASLAASQKARGGPPAGGAFVVRRDGKTVGSLTVTGIRNEGWSLLWGRKSAAGGGSWISVRDVGRMDDWRQDDALAMVPAGSLVEVLTAGRLIAEFLADPLGEPKSEHWTDSTRLNWPERI